MAELRFAYAARGYDYAGAIERVAGDEELLHSLLDMFAADSSFLKLMSALDAHDALEGVSRRAFAQGQLRHARNDRSI